jgi:hypothetical protein
VIRGTPAAPVERAGHHGVVRTDPQQPGTEVTPAAGHDAARLPSIYTAADRPRGLNAYFAPGGEDDATEERRLDERRNLRLLLAMVAALVLIPMLLTIAALAQELITHRSG